MSEETTTENGFTLSKFISSLTILSFAFGVINLFIYYNFFHLNVFEYLDLTEIVTHTIKDATLILSPYLFVLIMTLSIGDRTISTRNITNSNPTKKRRISFNLVFNSLLGLLLVCDIVEFYFDKIKLPVFMIQLFFLVVPTLFEIPDKARQYYFKTFQKKMDTYTYSFLICVVGIIYGSIMTSLISVNSTKVGHGTKGTYIIMQGDTIKSDTIYYYIGRTKNFVFFYNEKTKTTDIFPDKDIAKVSLKDNGY